MTEEEKSRKVALMQASANRIKASRMRLAASEDSNLTPLQKYRLENPPAIIEGASMDLAKQIENEFKPFLSPDLVLDGTDIELDVLRKKLIEIDKTIGRYHEMKFQLRAKGYEIAIQNPCSHATIDEIRRDSICAEIELIMSKKQNRGR